MKGHLSGFEVWRAPVALAVLSGVGLMAALVGDGLWDALSWAALGAPVVVCAWFLCFPRGNPIREP